MISLSVPRDTVRSTSLKDQWAIAEETAAANGQTVRREDWRLSVGCHLAETREQAFEDIRVGAGRVVTEYTGGTNGNPIPDVPANEVVDYMVEHNQWICFTIPELGQKERMIADAFEVAVVGCALLLTVGTPDDCIAGIERLQEASGGFGGLLLRAEDWAPRDKLHRSYELMARYVMPRYQGSLTGIIDTQQRSASMKEALQANRRAGLKRATDSYGVGNR